MGRGLEIGRIRGIPIRVHISLLIVLPLLAFLFGDAFRRAAAIAGVPPDRVSGTPYLWGLGIAIALFAAVLVHELAHSLYALKRGGAVRAITLMMVGGVSQMSRAPKGARAEAVMAAVGPLTSLAIGGIFFGLYAIFSHLVASVDLRFALFYVAYLNLVVGVFNLVPAFPMDGGRILRSLLSPSLGKLRATRVAAWVGKGLAVVFAVAALLSFNLFLLVVAAFVFFAADAETRQEQMSEALSDLRVGELMTGGTEQVGADASVREAAERMAAARQLALPVVRDGQPDGVVTLEDLERVAPAERADTLVARLLRRAPALAPGEEARRAYEALGEYDVPLLAVVDGGRLVGTLTREDLARAIRLRELRSPREPVRRLRRREAST